METPTNKKIRPQRPPTPKLSERKKSLFGREKRSPIREENDVSSVICGIAPLSPDTMKHVLNDCVNKSPVLRIKKFSPDVLESLKDKNVIELNLFNKSPKSTKLKKNVQNSENAAGKISLRERWGNAPQRTYNGPKSARKIFEDKMSDEDEWIIQTEPVILENMPVTPKKFTPSADELRVLFNDTLNFQNKKETRNIFDENSVSSSDEDLNKNKKSEFRQSNLSGQKRNVSEKSKDEPKQKILKIQNDEQSAKILHEINETSSPNDDMSISTKSFYSGSKINQISPTRIKSYPSTSRAPKIGKSKQWSGTKKNKNSINKNVYHKIKRDQKKSKLANTSVEDILKTIRSDKFKFLPSQRIFDEKLKKVSDVMKNSKNPIQMARPLNITAESANASINFSDSDESFSDNEMTNNEILEENTQQVDENFLTKRRFFKSGGHLVKNQYQLANKMKVTVSNGKLSFLPNKKKKRRSTKSKAFVDSFSAEQRTIDDIIEKLDATADDSLLSKPINLADTNENIINSMEHLSEPVTDDAEFAHFRNRIPYNTDDPDVIEQQHLLLDFLISNQICTEENFTIFIADPDNHKEKAAKIVDSLVVVVSETDNAITEAEPEEIQLTDTQFEQFRSRLPYNTTDPAIIQQQETLLDFLITNDICTEDTFNIFIADPDNHKEEAAAIIDSLVTVTGDNIDIDAVSTHSDEHIPFTNDVAVYLNETTSVVGRRMEIEFDSPSNPNKSPKQIENIQPNSIQNVGETTKLFPVFYPGKCQPLMQKSTRKHQPNNWNRGLGQNQYQIDAGQKEFGAKQCNKCGLVYTVHEPEEEKLHFEYHNSLDVLKFKGWIDEDVVMEFPEWGQGGRIIKVTNFSHPKRQERVFDILRIVDQELGFSSYITPTNFVAYFAVRRAHIVGLCLVKPLEKANKYICINGVDCCTDETFPAKCGISRIWVSPFHRRMRIASKLIKAVQLHTILGEEIDLNEIAFSAPTGDGKAFAKMITKRNDFLVYQ